MATGDEAQPVPHDLNDGSYWREFERNPLSHSMAHYLMAIDSLRNQYGYARATDVAELLEVSRGAASMALNQLKKRGWVGEDRHRFLLLTEAGQQIAERVQENFAVLAEFFEEILGVDHEAACADACKMEHLLSTSTGRRLLSLMQVLLGENEAAAAVRRHLARQKEGIGDQEGA